MQSFFILSLDIVLHLIFYFFFSFLDQQITKTAEVYISSVCFVKRYFYLLDAKNLCIKNTLKKEHKNMKKFKKEN